MIDYKVVKDPTVWGLQMKVNELVVEGYRPQGALVVDNGEYIQTLIKEIVDSVKEDEKFVEDEIIKDVLLNEEEKTVEEAVPEDTPEYYGEEEEIVFD